MKTVRRLFRRDIATSVTFVAVAFLSLFFFIDLVDEVNDIGAGYSLLQAVVYSVLQLPGHLYELMPIAVLIGTIYALARLAQSSEFTILRTGGLGPGRALRLLAELGLGFALLTYVVGDHIAPLSEQWASEMRALANGGIRVGNSNAWLKDRHNTPQGELSYSVNVGSTGAGGLLRDIRIFEFDADGRLQRRIAAASGHIGADHSWQLSEVRVTHWVTPGPEPLNSAASAAAGPASAPNTGTNILAHADEQRLDTLAWPSTLSANVVAAAVMPLSTMSTVALFRYIDHLSDNEQAAQRYEIQFWKRALYPFACLVMMALALPFAYMHARAGSISFKVFGGIMLGISFVLMNNMASHLGLLANWTPWIVAATPSALFLLLSMAAFGWLVYR